MDNTQYLTKEKMAEMQAELDQLRNVRRKEIAEHLEYAKKLGDLSENTEFHDAREEQAIVEDKIQHLENVLKTAKVVDERHASTVGIGSTVTVIKEGEKEEKKFKIVGSEEADAISGKLSNMSPLGSMLMGKKKGDSFKIMTPKGQVSYTLKNLE